MGEKIEESIIEGKQKQDTLPGIKQQFVLLMQMHKAENGNYNWGKKHSAVFKCLD